jgi:hypothetical protein
MRVSYQVELDQTELDTILKALDALRSIQESWHLQRELWPVSRLIRRLS